MRHKLCRIDMYFHDLLFINILRVEGIESYITKTVGKKAPSKTASTETIFKHISELTTGLKNELVGGNNLLVSDKKMNYKNAQNTCRAMDMNLG